MNFLTEAELESFVAENPAVAIHFDAAWDVAGLASIERKMVDAESVFADRVAFGYVDCEQDPELAKAIPILNVPTVAYYRNGNLVAAPVGARQNVRLRLDRFLRGVIVGYKGRR